MVLHPGERQVVSASPSSSFRAPAKSKFFHCSRPRILRRTCSELAVLTLRRFSWNFTHCASNGSPQKSSMPYAAFQIVHHIPGCTSISSRARFIPMPH